MRLRERMRLRESLNGWALRLSTSRLGVALVYHRIADLAGDSRYELVPALPTRVFQEQLHHLRTIYRIVPPSRLLQAALGRRRGDRFPVAITFDDDLLSHVEVVAPTLRRMRIPAGFFLCGASIDAPHSFWWEDLQALVDHGAAARRPRLQSAPEVDLGRALGRVPDGIHVVAEQIEQLPPNKRDAVAAELHSHTGESRRGLSAGEIETLAGAGFEIGFHTRRHYLLSTLDDAGLRASMDDGRERLETVVGRPLTTIAYPHGKADARVAEAARTAGYDLGFTASVTAAGPGTDPLLIGRVEALAVPLRQFSQTIAATLARGVL